MALSIYRLESETFSSVLHLVIVIGQFTLPTEGDEARMKIPVVLLHPPAHVTYSAEG